jgi:hypothetical protein
MARYWDEKDGNGKKLTDGRVCLVIEPEDASLPTIRTYGRNKDEVLEKVARTAETAQAEINRLRRAPKPTVVTPTVTASTLPPLTADEQARATADLSNPAKAPEAIKILLRGAGVDVDRMKLDEDARRISVIATEWERNTPDFPRDPRNRRLLMNTAVLRFGPNITADALNAAYQELLQHGMLFEAAAEVTPVVQPDGNQDSRTPVRNATSYRSTTLRGTAPVMVATPRYTRAQVDAMNSRQLRDKIENEAGFSDWYEKEFAAKTA